MEGRLKSLGQYSAVFENIASDLNMWLVLHLQDMTDLGHHSFIQIIGTFPFGVVQFLN